MHTLGRNVGFTGRIAVFDGRTFRGENPNIVPQRLSDALAESVGMIPHDKLVLTFECSAVLRKTSTSSNLHSSANSTKAKRRREWGSPQTLQSTTYGASVAKRKHTNITLLFLFL